MKLLISGLIICLLFRSVKVKHFRGGTITSKPIEKQGLNEIIQFTISFCWNSKWPSFPTRFFCDDSTIQSNILWGDPISGDRLIEFGGVCESGTLSTQTLTDVSTYCTSFSNIDEWSCGKRSFNYSLPLNCNYTAFFEGGDW